MFEVLQMAGEQKSKRGKQKWDKHKESHTDTLNLSNMETQEGWI